MYLSTSHKLVHLLLELLDVVIITLFYNQANPDRTYVTGAKS